MDQALAIAQQPPEQWGAAITRVREECPHADCGAPRNCRERVAEYLRVQYKSRNRRDARAKVSAR
jgi:hypothetical protein